VASADVLDAVAVAIPQRPNLHALYDRQRVRALVAARRFPVDAVGWVPVLVGGLVELVTTEGDGFVIPVAEHLGLTRPARFGPEVVRPFDLEVDDPAAPGSRRRPLTAAELVTALLGGPAAVERHAYELVQRLAQPDPCPARPSTLAPRRSTDARHRTRPP
jgi:hypothetical protein